MPESSFKVNNSPAQNCMQEIVRLSAHGGNICKMTFPGITPRELLPKILIYTLFSLNCIPCYTDCNKNILFTKLTQHMIPS